MAFQSRMAIANKKKQQITELKNSGSSFTVPAGVTKMLVTVIGGGGGGGFAYGSRTNLGQIRAAAASGAGGSSETRYFAVTPQTTCTYASGNGGAGGTSATPGSGGNGGNGGNTTFTYGGVTITGEGGDGGGSTQNRVLSPSFDIIGVAGLARGTTSGTPNVAPGWKLPGGNGRNGLRSTATSSLEYASGAAGSGAGTLNPGITPTSEIGVPGGLQYGGGGGSGAVVAGIDTGSGTRSVPGWFGVAFGGGGSGGCINAKASILNTRTANANGGLGNPGVIIITYWKR